ncbi:MAG: diguanylate cyclase [Desulfobacteraceae bacterium]|nr:diguanylate cyclase [Desulfobacteraceae bacterium]
MNNRFLQTSLSAGHLVLLAGTIWIVVIAASFLWNWHQVGDSMMVLVENEAQSASFGKRRTGLAIFHLLIGSLGLVGLEIGRRMHGRSERKLRENESLVRAINESAQDAIVVMDANGRISYWNPAAERIFDYTDDEAIGKDLHSMLAPSRYKKSYEAAFPKFQRSGRGDVIGKTLELKALRKSGEEFSMELSLSGVQLEDRWHAVGIIRDISERKEAEETIRQMAYHDSLTGLPNRKLFSDRLGIALAQAERSQTNVAVIMLDLDNLKDINDTLGHDAGDFLLKTAAERLNEAMRKSDTIARFGGDEFVLLLPELKGIEDATRVAQKIVESFRKPFLINTHQLTVTASIGIAVYPDDGSDEASLLKNADIAMYQAKHAGRNRYQVFKKS